ncbi:hypothetical protein HELRODRAFT_175852 [Helobdella robusta]|uniref:Uncharacterized protein n=1 Tax=Helobdella robusta TaxID=6412 RepID=T1F9S1_HELRO|nr:hypothetical protein HELRODRAFT_175852 [Helobdella robusta]ESO00429.1 hypothetical protein HELRODRAFT_175852 [Helobdella robusta]
MENSENTGEDIKITGGRVGAGWSIKKLIAKNGVISHNIKNGYNNCLVLGLLNVRSMISKVDSLYELIFNGLDILVPTETWHGLPGNVSVNLAMPPGYRFVDFVRPHDPGHGSLIVYFCSEFIYKKIGLPLFATFKVITVKLVMGDNDYIMVAIYQPGSVQITASLFSEFVSLLENIAICITILQKQLMYLVICYLVISLHNISVLETTVFPSEVYSDHSFIEAKTSVPKKRREFIRKQFQLSRSRVEMFMLLPGLIEIVCRKSDIAESWKGFKGKVPQIQIE